MKVQVCQKVLNQSRSKFNTMLGTIYRVPGCKRMPSQQIQYGGRPPYWKSCFGYISTNDCPTNAKFGKKKQNHFLTQVTWPQYQISKIQVGGRPPFWKWFYCYNAGNHLISMKFGAHTHYCASKDGHMTKCQNFANLQNGGRPPYWKSLFGYISTIYCLINAKFHTKKQNQT